MADTDEGVTFELKSALKYEEREHVIDDFHELLYDLPIVKECQGKIIITTVPKGTMITPNFSNAFLDTVYEAYNNHRHLVLRPDDIWMSIITSLSLYVNTHGKKMRETFVEHKGKIGLKVIGDGDIYAADWNQMVDNMVVLIDRNTKGGTVEWLEPNFSTTTQEIVTASKVSMMATFQKYFEYKMVFYCGIPKVTLKGKLEDWQALKLKVQNLRQLNSKTLKRWAKLLDFVLGKFEDAYKGDVDETFWSKICHLDPWGSGTNHFHGWMNTFIPFDEKGKYLLKGANPSRNKWCRINTNKIPPAVVEVPVQVEDNGEKHNTKFVAGFMVTIYDKTANTVTPSIDWAVIDLPEKNKCQEQINPDQWRELWKTFKKGIYFTNTRLFKN